MKSFLPSSFPSSSFLFLLSISPFFVLLLYLFTVSYLQVIGFIREQVYPFVNVLCPQCVELPYNPGISHKYSVNMNMPQIYLNYVFMVAFHSKAVIKHCV